MAKVFGVWDVDQFEDEIPVAMIAEWNNYLNYELSQYAEAIQSAMPAAGKLINSTPKQQQIITDPIEKGNIFDALGAK